MAPLATTTNTVPSRAAMAVAIDSNTRPPAARVREPILTTTRRERATTARASAISWASTMRLGEQLVEGRLDPPQRLPREAGGHPQERVDEDVDPVSLFIDHRRVGDRGRHHRESSQHRAI